MKIREALTYMSPSLSLQRAAADEIARLDKVVHDLERALHDRAQSNPLELQVRNGS